MTIQKVKVVSTFDADHFEKLINQALKEGEVKNIKYQACYREDCEEVEYSAIICYSSTYAK